MCSVLSLCIRNNLLESKHYAKWIEKAKKGTYKLNKHNTCQNTRTFTLKRTSIDTQGNNSYSNIRTAKLNNQLQTRWKKKCRIYLTFVCVSISVIFFPRDFIAFFAYLFFEIPFSFFFCFVLFYLQMLISHIATFHGLYAPFFRLSIDVDVCVYLFGECKFHVII